MDAWIYILMALGLIFLIAELIALISSYRDKKNLYRQADRENHAESSYNEPTAEDLERDIAYGYVKAKRNLHKDFFRTGQEILSNTAQTFFDQRLDNIMNRKKCTKYSQNYYQKPQNSAAEFDDYEEI